MTQTPTSRLAFRQFVAQMGDRFILPKELQQGDGETPFDSAARELAQKMAGTNIKKSTVRGLESLAWSTDSVGDILDYIRIRAGRDTKKEEWGARNIGAELAELLEKLQTEASQHLGEAPPEEVQALHLALCREFIKHLVAFFEFEFSGGLSRA